jgi:CDP-diacylglycerol---glycerol-3-phosphate 3-phosphatidyltransferase
VTTPPADHMAEPIQPVSAWNLANALTVLRLLLVPGFAALLLYDGGRSTTWRLVALVVFLAASATDSVDGELARRRGLITDFGKIADPIADKALTGAALVGLSLLGELSWVVTVVVLGREIGVTLLRFWVIRHGVIPASRGGKLKTILQMLAISLYIAPLEGLLETLAGLVMAAAVVVTVVTGLDYVVRAVRLRRTSARTADKRARESGRRDAP